MPLFDVDNRLSADPCAVNMRNRDNSSIAEYIFRNMRAACPDDGKVFTEDHPLALAVEHRNLWSWDGYGINCRAVDSDTNLKIESEVTHPRMRIQLPKRVFQASPNLAHGQAAPDVESRIVNGQDTSSMRLCNRLAERDFDRFDPGVLRVPVSHIIPPWVNGGAPSREISRSDQFLSSLGYVNDGKIWRRA